MGSFVWHEPSSFGTSVPENVCRLRLASREASALMCWVASSLVFGKRGLVLPEELDALTAETVCKENQRCCTLASCFYTWEASLELKLEGKQSSPTTFELWNRVKQQVFLFGFASCETWSGCLASCLTTAHCQVRSHGSNLKQKDLKRSHSFWNQVFWDKMGTQSCCSLGMCGGVHRALASLSTPSQCSLFTLKRQQIISATWDWVQNRWETLGNCDQISLQSISLFALVPWCLLRRCCLNGHCSSQYGRSAGLSAGSGRPAPWDCVKLNREVESCQSTD